MRPLTEGEVGLARDVFGDGIDYRRVRIVGRPFGRAAMTLGSWITFPPRPETPSDFSRAPIRLQAWFIHEMTHVWQFQGGWATTLWSWLRTLTRGGYGRGLPGYRYRLPLGAWGAYNLEQQASMVEHAFVLRRQGACASAPEGACLAEYEACVPFLCRGEADKRG
jgi:hypothetical protein